jgi:hypothetical protein
MKTWQQHELEWLRKRALENRLRRIFKADDDEDEADAAADDEDEANDDEATVAAALHYLLHTPHGAGVLRRVFPTGPGSTADVEHLARLVARDWRSQPPIDEPDGFMPWTDVTNKGTSAMENIVTIAKCVADGGRSWLTESELTEKIFKHAQLSRRDGESEHQAFARVFAANTSEGLAFRKAVAVAKSSDARPPGDDDDVAARAYRELERQAEARRKREPSLSPEQAFAKCFADPANRELANLAHQRPVAVW